MNTTSVVIVNLCECMCIVQVGAKTIVKLAYAFFEMIAEPESFQPYRIGKSVPLPDWCKALIIGVGGHSNVVSASISTPQGFVQDGDMVGFSNNRKLAKVKLAVQINNRWFLILLPLAAALGGGWSELVDDPIVVECDSVSGTLCYLIVGGKVLVG